MINRVGAAAVTAVCVLVASGCAGRPSAVPLPASTSASAAVSAGSGSVASPGAPDATSTASAAAASGRSTGWTVTMYYTAVQSLHSGSATPVTGCARIECSHGHTDLGTYPADFVTAVKDEGTGRTATGRYLNWSSDIGYWLDSAPRDSYGGVLRPYHSVAADPDTLRRGTSFTIASCGHADDGAAIPAAVCAKLRAAHWSVTDEFTPGLGGARHLDAYLGEETGPDFTNSDWYTTLTSAVLLLPA